MTIVGVPPRCPSPAGSCSDSMASLISTTVSEEGWYSEGLVVVVIGASGDLAKKKTYPSLFNLYTKNLLPEDTVIWGYARSQKTHQSLRAQLKPYLLKSSYDEKAVDDFLSSCYYLSGKSYGDLESISHLNHKIRKHEHSFPNKATHNRLFYLAIPPNVFGETGLAIKQKAMAHHGWTRIVIEKPFGRDLQSCMELSSLLSKQFDEDELYRIDHYLGKEMVQNILLFRFSNSWLDWMWNRNAIASVLICFKEPFGTEGRGGYFDQFGIIRDIIQNHLLQILTLVAMEPPIDVDGPESGDSIRDAKVHVLKAIPPITLQECLLGQYEGYTDDPTVENKNSNCPTFAALKCFVNTPRWHGVPFILKAGKALNEQKCEVRIQFKDAPAASSMISTSSCRRNELVMRLQPQEAIYMKTNVKSPGFSSIPVQSELEIKYHNKFDMSDHNSPDAYTKLILDVLRGKHAAFVRDDELKRSWEIFTPLLHRVEKENIKPVMYKCGTRGPEELDDFISEHGDYVIDDEFLNVCEMRKSAL